MTSRINQSLAGKSTKISKDLAKVIRIYGIQDFVLIIPQAVLAVSLHKWRKQFTTRKSHSTFNGTNVNAALSHS